MSARGPQWVLCARTPKLPVVGAAARSVTSSALGRPHPGCWGGGPKPRTLSSDTAVARRVVEALREIPTPVWGRDELDTGEMWNLNSAIAW